MKYIKLTLILLISIALVIAGYFGILILIGTLTDYKPEKIEKIEVENVSTLTIDSSRLTIFDWNIGYGGLGKDMDFFMDGGKKAITDKNDVLKNLEGIKEILIKNEADIYLIQEIDRNSRRSGYVDELDYLKENVFKNYNIAFAYNYKVLFVPVPYLNPTGKIEAGLATFSKYKIDEALRMALPGEYEWPTRLFQLDRCLILTRMKVKNGKDLVILNIHPSAYDPGGKLREQQLKFIMETAKKEYELGNYVIIGGDWNSEFFDNLDFKYTEEKPESYIKLPDFFKLEGWKWAIDNTVPTNRSLKTKYIPGQSFVTVIDGFYVSPNIEIDYVKNIDLNFEFTDHNPVILKITLVED